MAVSSETVVLLEVPFISGREQFPHCSGSFSFLNFVLFQVSWRLPRPSKSFQEPEMWVPDPDGHAEEGERGGMAGA